LQMKVPEIKKILKAKGLPRTGSKADLIALRQQCWYDHSDVYLSDVCVVSVVPLGFTTCRCHRNNYAGRAGGDAGSST
jgi:hypothetical protein